MTWVLILTLATSGTQFNGKAIHSVPMYDKKVCEVAGTTWLNKLDVADKRMATYVCVSNGAVQYP